MTNSAPVILTDPSQSQEVVITLGKMQELEKHLENMPEVATADDASLVSEYRTQLKKQARDLDNERKTMTEPLRSLTTTLNQKFNVHIERAERAAKLCDNLLMPYMREQKRIREEAEAAERARKAEEQRLRQEEEETLRKAQQIAAETKDATALKAAEAGVSAAKAALNQLGTRTSEQIVPSKSVTGSLGAKTGLREIWKYRVVDISKVPEEYLVDPEDRIRKRELNLIAKSQKGDAHVPGIEFYSEDILSSTAASSA